MGMLSFLAGCVVGFILAVFGVALGIAATKRGRRWEP